MRTAILNAYPKIEIRIYVTDAKECKPITETGLEKIISGLNLTVLINNVGVGGQANSPAEIDSLININDRFPAQITNFLLPTLIKNSPSLILAIGSGAELGMPWLSVYAGTKAFNMSWGKALSAEMKAEGHDVEVLSLKVSEVNVPASPVKESWVVPNGRKLAKCALQRVGCGHRVVSAYWMHEAQRAAVEMLPDWVVERMLIDVGMKRRAQWVKKE